MTAPDGAPEPRSGERRSRLLFVGTFPPPGSAVQGGNAADCHALLGSSLPRRMELLLVDSSAGSGPQTLWRRLARAGKRIVRFVRLVHSARPDAVLLLASYGLGFVEKSLLALYARFFGIPSLLSVRSGHFIDQCHQSRAFRAAAWLLLRAPARLVCQGRRWQELFQTRFGLPRGRCPVVDAWVATDELLRLGRERRTGPRVPVTILYLGALERAKGLLELLEAYSRIRADPSLAESVLVIGGEGPLSDELRRRVRELGLEPSVRFAGLLAGEARSRSFAEADLFVLPSHTEGLPNAMIEAMAAGLPVVVTPVGSIPDVIVHGENGCLVAARDPAALERELRRLIASPELRSGMGREAHRLAASRFSPEGAAERIEALVHELAPVRPPPRPHASAPRPGASGGSAPGAQRVGSGPPARVPGLDGLRAVAILFVIFGHAVGAAARGRSDPWMLVLWGQIGTSSFFALSGFLITLLLLREYRSRGAIDLRAFFTRRAIRILPPLWAFLLVSVLVAPLFRPAFDAGQILKVLLFVVDYAPTNAFWLDHTWSLGATEQFYLLWPFALLVALPDRAERLGWWLMALSPVLRVGAHFLGVPGKLAMAFHTVIDAFVIGCLLAIVFDRDRQHWVLGLLRRGWVAGLSCGFLLIGSPALSHAFGGAYFATVGLTLRAFAIGSVIVWAGSSEEGPIRKVLNHRWLVRVGLMSYSLYLWQQPFFDADVHATWVGSLPVALLGSFGLAELSYRFLELPIGRYRAQKRRDRPAARTAAGPA